MASPPVSSSLVTNFDMKRLTLSKCVLMGSKTLFMKKQLGSKKWIIREGRGITPKQKMGSSMNGPL